MKIARFQIGGRPTIAIDGGDGFIDYGLILESHGYKSEILGSDPEKRIIRMLTRGLLDEEFITEQLDWAKRTHKLVRLSTDKLVPLLPYRPSKIVCVARNYVRHAAEQGHNLPDAPVFFAKTDNTPVGPGNPICVPPDAGRVDHEGELGVVISKQASRVPSNEAVNYIFGYTIVNDVTARGMQHKLSDNKWPWYLAKSMDSFAPMGPWIITAKALEPLSGKSVRVSVNKELRQDGVFDDMHWNVPALVEAITRYITLQPGDIIATGTPEGIGPIIPGDTVTVEIDGIGRLTNPVEAR